MSLRECTRNVRNIYLQLHKHISGHLEQKKEKQRIHSDPILQNIAQKL